MPRLTPRRPASPRAAFTLVELLVVIGIIALLISILLPALNRARAGANSVKCLANLRSIGQLINIYTTQSKGVLPPGKDVPASSSADKQTDWSYLLLAMVTKQSDGTYATRTASVNARRLFVDTDTVDQQGNLVEGTDMLHYSSHPRLMPDINAVDPLHTPAKYVPYKISGIKRNAEIVLIMDGVQVIKDNFGYRAQSVATSLDWTNGNAYDTNLNRFSKSPYLNFDDAAADNGNCVKGQVNQDFKSDASSNLYGPANGIRWRHLKSKSANFLFCDGHAEPRAWKDANRCDLMRSNINVNIR